MPEFLGTDDWKNKCFVDLHSNKRSLAPRLVDLEEGVPHIVRCIRCLLGQLPLAIVPHLRNRRAQPPPRGTPKNRFKTVRAPRTTSRTSTPWMVTGECPPVEKTVTSVGTARIKTSNSQNLCQSTSLRCMGKLSLSSLGEKARLRCFVAMIKRAVVTGYTVSEVTKGKVGVL